MRSTRRATAQALARASAWGPAWGLAWGLALAVLPPQVQAMPTQEAFEAAVQAARPEAARLGLQLRTDGLWQQLLRSRTPLLAGVSGRQCFIGYSPYTPGRAYGWLFPDLPPDEARTWLAALVRHELAHCLDALEASEPLAPGAGAAAGTPVSSAETQHRREVLADLAFAQYALHHSPNGRALVARLADLRAERAGSDPVHDSSAALRCVLAEAQAQAQPHDAHDEASGAELPAVLAAWQARCLPVPQLAAAR